jgi:hypothetical protein
VALVTNLAGSAGVGGNHTIRRIDITTGIVTTLADKAGSAGSSDGAGISARFAYPAGITLSGDGAIALVAAPDDQTLRRLSFVPVAPQVALPLVRR